MVRLTYTFSGEKGQKECRDWDSNLHRGTLQRNFKSRVNGGTVLADVQFVGLLGVVVVKPDEFVPLKVVLKTVKEGKLKIGLQRESEFSSQDLAFEVHDYDFK